MNKYGVKAFKTEGDFKKWKDNSKHPIKEIPSKSSAKKKEMAKNIK